MPRLCLTPRGQQRLDELVSERVASRVIPASFVGLTDAAGDIYFRSEGSIDYDDPAKGSVKEDTIIQLFSSTKLVTTVACLQLCDRGLVSLDDGDIVKKILPELNDLKIIKGLREDGSDNYEDVSTQITLRMLLNHTSGFGYNGNDPLLTAWVKKHDFDCYFLRANTTENRFKIPLLFQPGTKWHYGMGIDWAGILVSRLVGKNLENHYRECIFDPAGMIDTTFFPSSSIKSRMMNLTHDPGDGQIKTLHDNFSSIPSGLDRTSEPDETGPVLAGGAGLFSTARDYLAFLRGIMASGPAVRDCFPPAIPLLSTESFKELFIDSIPSSADRSYFLDTIKAQNYHDPALLLERVDGRRRAGHSVGLLLNFEDSCHGRKAGSGCWDGAARTQYWLDPTTGLAGICMTNIMTDDAKAIKKFYNDVEKAAYEALSY